MHLLQGGVGHPQSLQQGLVGGHQLLHGGHGVGLLRRHLLPLRGQQAQEGLAHPVHGLQDRPDDARVLLVTREERVG